MSDLEMTKLCAEAMGLDYVPAANDVMMERAHGLRQRYTPLTDDEQAMALVKRFELELVPPIAWMEGRGWCVRTQTVRPTIYVGSAWSPDLNRAIVECVAKMQSQVRPQENAKAK